NRMRPGHSIEMKLLEGPFRYLSGIWTFQALSGPDGEPGCKVALDLEFEMSNRLTQAVLGPLVGQMLNAMVDAFGKRARQVYG
ncbi:MAG: SRPBCC family protein, partial [Endozoicomonas sp.]